MMGTATLVKKIDGWTGDARLYRLDPPIEYERWGEDDEDETPHTAEYVIVSATVAWFSGPETYVFPAEEDGEVRTWGEIGASQKGTLSHDVVLADSGYEVLS